MKNLRNTCLLLVLSVAMSLAWACSFGPSPQEVAEKIDSNETLTQADYNCILEYLNDYADREEEAAGDPEKIRTLNNDYKHWFTFAFALMAAPPEVVQSEKYRELEQKLNKSKVDEAVF